MQDPALHWYALKIFFNKVFEAELLFDDWQIETYLAVRKVPLKGEAHLAAKRRLARLQAEGRGDTEFIQDGMVILRREPMVNSLLFARMTAKQAKEVGERLRMDGSFSGFIYKDALRKDYAVIPDTQMSAFRLVTESGVTGLEFFADDDFTRYKEGGKVRVKEGPLKGAEGYIKRIRKDRRLLVSIQGVVAVATSFIPPENLELVPED